MLIDTYLESVFRLDYQDDVEWETWKKAYISDLKNYADIFQDRIFERLCCGLTFQELCFADKALYRSKLSKKALNLS